MTAGQATLRGRRILVVDDDYLVAQVVVALLEEAGAEVVGPLGWIDEALAFIQSNHATLDGVVLDVDLHGRKSYPVADLLAANDIPFVFATGYGAAALDGDYRRFPRCEKPFDQQALVAALGGS
jgi:CheY-like chemotaxis protein